MVQISQGASEAFELDAFKVVLCVLACDTLTLAREEHIHGELEPQLPVLVIVEHVPLVLDLLTGPVSTFELEEVLNDLINDQMAFFFLFARRQVWLLWVIGDEWRENTSPFHQNLIQVQRHAPLMTAYSTIEVKEGDPMVTHLAR